MPMVDSLSGGSEQEGGSSIEVLEFARIDFGHLEDGNAGADHEEAEHDSEDLGDGSVEALV
jgi:hypothetical protein